MLRPIALAMFMVAALLGTMLTLSVSGSALGPESPAIDAGSCTDSTGITVTVDQRGVARPLGDGCDIGALESPYTSTFAISTTSLPLIRYEPFPCPEIVTPCNLTRSETLDSSPTWSPDGRYLAFTRYDDSASIYRMNADGTGVILLVEDGEKPLWSPDGSKMAFLRRGDDGNSDLFVMDTKGGQPTNISNSAPMDERNIAWSPNGSMLLFDAYGLEDVTYLWNIYVVNADGSQRRKVVTSGMISISPWSPDGSKFVYSKVGNEGSQLHVMNVDGSNQIIFEFPGESAFQPAWSPDGNWIAYVCLKGLVYQICTMRSDGSQRTMLSQGEAQGDGPIQWSPDSSKLLFLRIRFDPDRIYDLAVIPATGGDAIQLTQGEIYGYIAHSRWSPDGSKVAFASLIADDLDVYVVGVAEEE